MKTLRLLQVAFRAATALFLLTWLPAVGGCRAAHVLYLSSWAVVLGLTLVLAVAAGRSP